MGQFEKLKFFLTNPLPQHNNPPNITIMVVPFAPGMMVQAWVGQKLLKRDILRVFSMSHFINF
jgi:hypothetical protein